MSSNSRDRGERDAEATPSLRRPCPCGRGAIEAASDADDELEWPDRVRRLLEERDWSVERLADAVGVTSATVARWLDRETTPNGRNRDRLHALETELSSPLGVLRVPSGVERIREHWEQADGALSPWLDPFGDRLGRRAERRFEYWRYLGLLLEECRLETNVREHPDVVAHPLQRVRRTLAKLRRCFANEIRQSPLERACRRAELGKHERRILTRLIGAVYMEEESVPAAELLDLVTPPSEHPLTRAGLLAPDAPLRAEGLVELVGLGDPKLLWMFDDGELSRGGPLKAQLALTDVALRELGAGVPFVAEPGSEECEPSLALVTRPPFGLERLVLPERLEGRIREAVRLAAHGATLERWGFDRTILSSRGVRILLSGPPGTGKTLAARAIAGELERPLHTASIARLFSKWLGDTEKHLARAFEEARKNGAVLLLDEADAIVGNRVADAEGYEIRIIDAALREIENHEGVLILTTNLVGHLDPALERRLAQRLVFELPGPTERARILRLLVPGQAPLDDDVDLSAIAAGYELSGGSLENVVLGAARRALSRASGDDIASVRITHQDFVVAAGDELAGAFDPDRAGRATRLGFGRPQRPVRKEPRRAFPT